VARMIDPAHIADLKALMEEDFELLIRTYLEDGPRHLKGMAAALAEQDAEGLRRQAHSLKGASSNLGAGVLAGRLQQLEDCARLEDWESASELLPKVANDFDQVQGELTECE
jgi:histidine phosphotransfer protein HptB